VMAGMVALLNYPAPARTIHRASGRWTPEELATIVPHTLAFDVSNPAPPKDV
jgi:hypothetical protein